MSDAATPSFDSIDRLLDVGGPAAFDALIERFRSRGEHARLFEARLMKRRHELGLPLIPSGSDGTPEHARAAYDATVVEAAREAGTLFLNSGQIARAWPYFRAIGEPGPVRGAIEALPIDCGDEPAIEVALQEMVHPGKGFEMLLAHHGICRAITLFDQYPDTATRGGCLALLVRTLHRDLAASLKRAVESAEGAAPDTNAIPELLRPWMFGPYDYFVDVSHLGSIVRYAPESTDPAVLGLALELTEYGRRLAPELQYKGDAPFEDLYADHAIFLRAILGEDAGGCATHFNAKLASYDWEQTGTYPAQIVVKMLVRLGRHADAVACYETYCKDADRTYLNCPPLEQLCLLAGDYGRLENLARQEGDELRYLAAKLTSRAAAR